MNNPKYVDELAATVGRLKDLLLRPTDCYDEEGIPTEELRGAIVQADDVLRVSNQEEIQAT